VVLDNQRNDMTNLEYCPQCGGFAPAKATPNGIQHRKCDEYGFRYRTKKVIVMASKDDDIKTLLADYGHAVNPKIIEQLQAESNVEEIRHYLDNQARMISHYEMENQPVKNPTGFMMNAILTHYPMPPNWYDGQAVSVSASQLNGHSASQLNGHEIPKNEAADTWAGILERLEQVMTRATFDNCLRNSKGVYQSESMLVVQVVRRSALEWIEERLIESIQRESELEIRFIV